MRHRVHQALIVMGSLIVLGCFADGGIEAGDGGLDDDFMDDPPPPGDCQTGCPTPGSEGSELGGPCLNTSDCTGNGICAAEFDGQVQSFICQAACIPQMDEAQWCSDDASCCDAGVCSSRGFCLPPGETTGLDTGGSETGLDSSGTTDFSSTGETDSSSTGGSGSSGGSSSTG